MKKLIFLLSLAVGILCPLFAANNPVVAKLEVKLSVESNAKYATVRSVNRTDALDFRITFIDGTGNTDHNAMLIVPLQVFGPLYEFEDIVLPETKFLNIPSGNLIAQAGVQKVRCNINATENGNVVIKARLACSIFVDADRSMSLDFVDHAGETIVLNNGAFDDELAIDERGSWPNFTVILGKYIQAGETETIFGYDDNNEPFLTKLGDNEVLASYEYFFAGITYTDKYRFTVAKEVQSIDLVSTNNIQIDEKGIVDWGPVLIAPPLPVVINIESEVTSSWSKTKTDTNSTTKTASVTKTDTFEIGGTIEILSLKGGSSAQFTGSVENTITTQTSVSISGSNTDTLNVSVPLPQVINTWFRVVSYVAIEEKVWSMKYYQDFAPNNDGFPDGGLVTEQITTRESKGPGFKYIIVP